MQNTLENVKDEINNKLLLYQTPGLQWVPSSVYRYEDLKESLHVMATEGVAGKKFYIGESGAENGHVYGLVNLAAFLAQSMKETIQYDACDENYWDLVGGKYPLSKCVRFGLYSVSHNIVSRTDQCLVLIAQCLWSARAKLPRLSLLARGSSHGVPC